MSNKDFSVKKLDLNDLVIAPSLEPFSDYEPARMGEAALLHAIREWDLSGRKDFSTFAIHMPHDKIKTLDTGGGDYCYRLGGNVATRGTYA